jgi:hypothetical protein
MTKWNGSLVFLFIFCYGGNLWDFCCTGGFGCTRSLTETNRCQYQTYQLQYFGTLMIGHFTYGFQAEARLRSFSLCAIWYGLVVFRFSSSPPLPYVDFFSLHVYYSFSWEGLPFITFLNPYPAKGTQDSSAGIVPRLRAGELRNRGFVSQQGPMPLTCHEGS